MAKFIPTQDNDGNPAMLMCQHTDRGHLHSGHCQVAVGVDETRGRKKVAPRSPSISGGAKDVRRGLTDDKHIGENWPRRSARG
jgi:hypothetical protein